MTQIRNIGVVSGPTPEGTLAAPRLSRDARSLFDRSRELLREAGVDDCECEFRGSHPAVVFTHQGRRQRVTFPLTPSDGRTWLNMRAQLRRILGSMGDAPGS